MHPDLRGIPRECRSYSQNIRPFVAKSVFAKFNKKRGSLATAQQNHCITVMMSVSMLNCITRLFSPFCTNADPHFYETYHLEKVLAMRYYIDTGRWFQSFNIDGIARCAFERNPSHTLNFSETKIKELIWKPLKAEKKKAASIQ